MPIRVEPRKDWKEDWAKELQKFIKASESMCSDRDKLGCYCCPPNFTPEGIRASAEKEHSLQKLAVVETNLKMLSQISYNSKVELDTKCYALECVEGYTHREYAADGFATFLPRGFRAAAESDNKLIYFVWESRGGFRTNSKLMFARIPLAHIIKC